VSWQKDCRYKINLSKLEQVLTCTVSLFEALCHVCLEYFYTVLEALKLNALIIELWTLVRLKHTGLESI